MRGAVAKVGWFAHAAALFALAASVDAAEIRAVKLSPETDHTRAVVDVHGQLDYKLFEIGSPDRIVLDIRDATLAPNFVAPDGTGLLKSVRTGRLGKDGVRIVFDLAAAVRPKSFLQPAGASGGSRLVVDLYKKAKARRRSRALRRLPPSRRALRC